MEGIVVLRNVSKRFGPTVALNNVSLSVSPRSFLVLLGPNGSGKSTLIDVVSGFRRPSSGYVRVFGFDPWRERGRIAHRVACLSDRLSLKPWSSCLDIVEKLVGKGRVDPRRVKDYASRLGVDQYWRRAYVTYSAGMRRKCLLLLTLSTNADLIIIDEPFENLDPEAIRTVLEILGERHREGSTIIVASHIVGGLEKLATHVAILVSGRLVEYGESVDVASKLGGLKLVATATKVSEVTKVVEAKRFCISGNTIVIDVENVEEAEKLRSKLGGMGVEARLEIDLETVYRRALERGSQRAEAPQHLG